MTQRPSWAGSALPDDRRVSLLGVTVDAITSDELTTYVIDAVADGRRHVIANHNLHSVALVRNAPELADFYRKADVTFIDGTWLVWLGRLIGVPLYQRHRTTYLDWLDRLFSSAVVRNWNVVHVGTGPAIADQACEVLRSRFPGLRVSAHHGYFNTATGSTDNEKVLEWVRRCAPDLLLVGMGMPRQELWVLDHLEAFPECVVLTSGACFGYLGGEQKAPPRWSGKVGLEWAFRLIYEPRRLWKRYLLEPIPVVLAAVRETTRSRLGR